MSTESHHPTEKGQLENFLKAREELKEIPQVSGLLKTLLSGMHTIIPAEIEQSRVYEKEDILHAANQMLKYGIALNDRIDFVYVDGEGIDEIVKDCELSEANAFRDLEDAVTVIEDPAQRLWIQESLSNYRLELEIVEQYVRTNRDNLTFDDAVLYRRFVNSINTCLLVGTLLGRQHLKGRMATLTDEEMNWEGIQEKYGWIFQNEHDNAVESAVAIMDRMNTVGQIDDDWAGREIDAAMGVPSIALLALDECKGDEIEAQVRLHELRNAFKHEARQLGLGKLPTEAVSKASQLSQQFNRKMTMSRRRVDPLLMRLNIHVRTHPMKREKAFIEGVLK